MSWNLRLASVSLTLPKFFAGLQVKTKHEPVMYALGRGSNSLTEIQTFLRPFVVRIADDGH